MSTSSLRAISRIAPGAHPIGAGLVLLDLLVGDFEGFGELLLGHAELGPPQPDALADMRIDALGPDPHMLLVIASPVAARGSTCSRLSKRRRGEGRI